ncbi:PfkB family carbohydrate kinase [Capnocytophaga sp. oral taxon 878]|uniref:PfkB family carbohydrate kinase n=1 Tax=Capnocytophaga sp. oral taxon 878 TaxID=1316596 RepID=UPI000D043F15|nr:PfkB family carbohydrate kinase [Capnocytophaga sp. oral taxon 878]AVM50903.1 sugar kinase [Capnocytophaga sp. oral taxon 878]
MSKLLILGSIAFDQIETPFGKTDVIMGGSANYIALAASQFEVPQAVLSIVGSDYPKSYLNLLSQRGIRTEGIEVVEGGKTLFWSGKYHNDMNQRDTLDTQLNVITNFNPVVPEDFRDAEVLLLGNLHPNLQMDVLQQMSSRPKLVVMDTMNYWMNHTWELLQEMIAKVDVLTINDEEARQLTGEYSLVKAAQRIIGMGVKYVVIKKGEHGALLFHKDKVFYAPALPLAEVFDPTGAGDAFAGGMVGYLAKTADYSFENLKNAIVHGSNIASFCIEKFGAERLLNLNKEELYRRLQQFKDLTQFDIQLK